MTREEFDLKLKIQHDWNVLLDGSKSRFEKTKAMSVIEQEWKSWKVTEAPPQFEWFVLGAFQVLTSESVEKLRVSALGLLQQSFSLVQDWTTLISIVLQVIRPRLMDDRLEESEELRRDIMSLLISIFREGVPKPEVFPIDQVEPLISLLSATAQDPFQDVRRESFVMVALVSDKFPFLVKPHVPACLGFTLSSLGHRHASVRSSAIHAVGRLLHVDVDSMRDCIENHLKRLLFDTSPSVRMVLYQTFRDFCLTHRDRYSVHWMTMTILLGGCCDDSEKHVKFCKDSLDEFADLAELELRDQMRDMRDFNAETVTMGGRIKLGLAYLIRDGLYKIVHQQLLPDLLHWQPNIRHKTLQILEQLIPLSGTHCTGYSLALCQNLWKILLSDDEPSVRSAAFTLIPLLAEQLPLKFLLKILLDLFDAPGVLYCSSQETVETFARLLVAILAKYPDEGDASDLLYTATESLERNYREFHQRLDPKIFAAWIKGLLLKEGFLPGQQFKLLLLRFALTLSLFCDEQVVMMTLMDDVAVVNEFLENRDGFALDLKEAPYKQSLSLSALSLLYRNHASEKFDHTKTWDHILLSHTLAFSEEPSVHAKYLEFAAEFLNVTGDDHYVSSLLDSVYVPSLVWKGGRQFVPIRETCMKILETSSAIIPMATSKWNAVEGLKHIISCLDEDSSALKKSALGVVKKFLLKSGFQFVDENNCRNLVKELVSRLDDSDETIRVLSSQVIALIVGHESFDSAIDAGNWEYVMDALFVHLDDPDSAIQNTMADTLAASKRHKAQVFAKCLEQNQAKVKRARHLLPRFQ